MPRYLVELPHTIEDCLPTLDEVLDSGPDELAKYEWGCKTGEHSAWTTLEAATIEDARARVPATLHSRARVVQLGTFTPEEILSYHRS